MGKIANFGYSAIAHANIAPRLAVLVDQGPAMKNYVKILRHASCLADYAILDKDLLCAGQWRGGSKYSHDDGSSSQ